jgi:hypothetical protein
MDNIKKVESAHFFLNQLEKEDQKPDEFEHYLYAFSLISQAIIQKLNLQVKGKPYQIWYENSLENSPLFSFFAADTNLGYHIKTQNNPPKPENNTHKSNQDPHPKSFFESIYEHIRQLSTGDPIKSPSNPIQDKETQLYYFNNWEGNEDVPDLCGRHLKELHNLISEGEQLNYI